MNRAVAGFLIELCFTVPLGVGIGRFIYITPKGIAMNAAAKAKVAALGNRVGLMLDWIGRGRRLAVFIVAIGFLVLGVYGYTYQSAQSSRDAADRERAAFYACVPRYVKDLTRSNLPRTIASIKASNARFHWDIGHDPKHPTWDRARLFEEYQRLYRKYLSAIAANPPIPAFSAKYCEGPSASVAPTPAPTPSKPPASKHHHSTKSSSGSVSSPSTATASAAGGGKTGSPSTPSAHRGTARPSPTKPTGSPSAGSLLGLPGLQQFICELMPETCILSAP